MHIYVQSIDSRATIQTVKINFALLTMFINHSFDPDSIIAFSMKKQSEIAKTKMRHHIPSHLGLYCLS